MIPPTSIDGTDITGATIDGTDVTEITVDGQTVFSATSGLPNSTVIQYDASQLTGLSDGDPVSTWPDTIGTHDLTANGSPTYRNNVINGLPTVEFDEGPFFDATGNVLSAGKISVLAVARTINSNPDIQLQQIECIMSSTSTNCDLIMHIRDRGDAGVNTFMTIEGASYDNNFNIYAGVVNGANTQIRKNGVVSGTGTKSDQPVEDLRLGVADDLIGELDGDIAELIVLSDINQTTDAELYLSQKYGITI